MNDEYTIISHDLLILEEMAANMGFYLDSNAVDWTIPRVNMPKLTIGGYLMRQHRLEILASLLKPQDTARLRASIEIFDGSLLERIVRFETRAHQELHNRISEWMGHMRELGSRMTSGVNYYSGIVDTRVVITSLIERLQTQPFKLESGIVDKVDALDKNLRARIDDHPFIWEPIWITAYPRDKYWWLYGRPKHVPAA